MRREPGDEIAQPEENMGKVLKFKIPAKDMYAVWRSNGRLLGAFQVDTKTGKLDEYTEGLFCFIDRANLDAEAFIGIICGSGHVVEQMMTRRNEELPCTVKHQA